jgi:hypothetical protein
VKNANATTNIAKTFDERMLVDLAAFISAMPMPYERSKDIK